MKQTLVRSPVSAASSVMLRAIDVVPPVLLCLLGSVSHRGSSSGTSRCFYSRSVVTQEVACVDVDVVERSVNA